MRLTIRIYWRNNTSPNVGPAKETFAKTERASVTGLIFLPVGLLVKLSSRIQNHTIFTLYEEITGYGKHTPAVGFCDNTKPQVM